MTLPKRKHRGYTLEDWQSWEGRWELINGVAYAAAGVPKYLIVDPEGQFGLLLRLEGGRYEESSRVEWGAAVALLGGKLSVALEGAPP